MTTGVPFSKVKSHTKGANNSATHHCLLYRERLKHYCHPTLLEGTTTEYAEEGKLSEKHEENYELIHAHVVARHGDRTPAIKMPNFGYPEVAYQCGLDAKQLSPNWGQKRDLWLGLGDFPPLTPLGNVRNAKLKLHSGSPDEPCQIGDLTSLGYLQHLNLGYLMQSRYVNLFPGLEIKDQVYVQSTDYRRTIRSAGAFLLGFIPDGRRLREMVTIHIQPGNLNQAPPVGIPWTYKPCNDLEKLRGAENQRAGYYSTEKRSHWMQERVIDMFKLKVHRSKTPWTELFDHFTVRGCHSLQKDTVLPCTKDGKCINCGLGEKMFDFADWSMAEKYPTNSSLLACLPFLKHSLVDTMEAAMSDPHTTKYRIMLTFTHDSTLNRLFKSLGLSVGEWVPYASRLAFEVWRTANGSESARDFVRVLFNGKTVTQELPFSNGSELVPFAKWKDSILHLNLWAYRKLCSI